MLTIVPSSKLDSSSIAPCPPDAGVVADCVAVAVGVATAVVVDAATGSNLSSASMACLGNNRRGTRGETGR